MSVNGDDTQEGLVDATKNIAPSSQTVLECMNDDLTDHELEQEEIPLETEDVVILEQITEIEDKTDCRIDVDDHKTNSFLYLVETQNKPLEPLPEKTPAKRIVKSQYFKHYHEWLRENSLQAKAEREKRMAEIHPEPKPQPSSCRKMARATPPAWVNELAAKETQAKIEEMKAWRKISDRKAIKRNPRIRTLRLAWLSESKQLLLKDLIWLREKEQKDRENCFKAKPVKKLPKKSRIFQLAKPLERRQRNKIKCHSSKVRFVNYW